MNRQPIPRRPARRRALLGLAPLLLLSTLASSCGYNSSIAADEKVKEAWANVENVYQRRADLVPNLVNVVKGAAAQEKQVLTEVTAARASATQIKLSAADLDDPQKLEAFAKAQDQLSGALGRLLAVSERYPELKSLAAFRDLQAQLEGTENRIAVERRRYNEAVADYNRIVRQFPTMIGARIAGLKPRPPYQATTAGADKAPEVKF